MFKGHYICYFYKLFVSVRDNHLSHALQYKPDITSRGFDIDMIVLGKMIIARIIYIYIYIFRLKDLIVSFYLET